MVKDIQGLTEKEFLDSYQVANFERPSVTVDNLIFTIDELINKNIRKLNNKKLQVLLVKRESHPFINTWCLPGVFVKIDETLEAASLRCLETKAKTRNIYLEQLYTFGDVSRDPRTRILSIAYMGLVDKKRITITEETSTTSWFNININQEGTKNIYHLILENNQGIKLEAKIEKNDENLKIIDNKNIGFDHAKIIFYGLIRMRNKLEYTDIAFSLLPEKFTLAELQQVYETILDKKLTKPNFQRKIRDKVLDLNEYKTGGYRPAKLYIYKR